MSIDAERLAETAAPLPGHSLSENDQRQI